MYNSSVETPLSIVIPVHNEERIIVPNTDRLLSFLRQRFVLFEILLVDNGSTDRTYFLSRSLEDTNPEVRSLRIDERGAGLAFKEAVRNAKYEHLICLDMDLPHDFSFVEEASRLLEEAVIVIGSKRTGAERRGFFRKIAGSFYIFLAKSLLRLPFTDYSIGAKAYKRSFVLRHLDIIDRHTHYVFALCLKAISEHEKIIEIPVFCEDRRESHFNLLHEGFYRIFMLLRAYVRSKMREEKEKAHPA
jgi:glycosyltransferase involved in cell wall biosynthesis